IYTRLEVGLETSLHNASQWLAAFQVPGTAPDIKAILQNRGQPGFDPDKLPDLTLVHTALEREFLGALWHDVTPELRQRLNLPTKLEKIQTMFTLPEHQLIYSFLAANLKNPDFDPESILGQARDFYDQYVAGRHLKHTTTRDDFDSFMEGLRSALLNLRYPADQRPSKPLTQYVHELVDIG